MDHVYICACAPEGGIYHYVLQNGGNLVFQDRILLDRPMYLVKDGQKLYTLLRAPFQDSTDSGLVSIPLDADGRMGAPSMPQSTHGVVAAHLCVHNSDVFIANYLSGNVVKAPSLSIQHSGHSVNPVRQEGPHPHYIYPTPDNRFIAAVDLGTDTIITYDTELNLRHAVKVPPGNGCRHLAFSPDGKYAYCANELSSDISIFRYHAGVFEYLHTILLLPEAIKQTSIAAAIRCTEDYVYISHRGYDKITQLKREGSSLSVQSEIDCGGHWPRDFQLAGSCIICTNEKSNNVSVIHQSKVVYQLSLPSPICVLVT